ncbi:MAG: pilin [Candidatus Altiarchaeota archaeon]
MKIKVTKALVMLGLMALVGQVAAQFPVYSLDTLIYTLTDPILCSIYNGFKMIAGGLAVVMLVLAGVKWMSAADDPPARKVAKDMVIHTVIALIIIVLATLIVDIASGGQLTACP